MSKQTVLVAIAACLAGFIAGFIFANRLNRSDNLSKPAVLGVSSVASPSPTPAAGDTLSTEEIKARTAEADRDPTNFSYQKGLGLALYRYASMKQDAAILPETIRIMERALALDPADRDLVVGLGNAHFDEGYFKKDNSSFERARGYYNKALNRVPGDADVRTDLALTYFLQEPPDLKTAAAEFEKGLQSNPRHERSLEFLAQTFAKQNDLEKAAAALDRLKAVNSSNPAIRELMTMIAAGGAAK